MIGRGKEDILEAIHILSKRYYIVRNIDIASFLGISKPYITTAVRELIQSGYVEKNDENAIILTESGRNIAESVYERHCYFREWLLSAGVDEQTAEKEACALEHAISDNTFALLRAAANGNCKAVS